MTRSGRKTVDCQCRAFQRAIDVLGRPWNALILTQLQSRPLRFSELAAAAQGPGDKVLSARLKELEASGLVVRRVDAGPPVRVTYQLTPEGQGFGQVASAIERWGRCLSPPGTEATLQLTEKPSDEATVVKAGPRARPGARPRSARRAKGAPHAG